MIKNRKIFNKLLDEAVKTKVSIILGPRQVGKTTTLRYIYENIVVQKKLQGIFLDLDIYSNFEKVSTYENAINTFKLAGYNTEGKDIFYVLLDEFQRYKDLSVVIKNIHDHHKNIKIYATGSSSLAIKHKIQESLSGRKVLTYLYPLDFEEFLYFKDRQEQIEMFINTAALRGDDLYVSTRDLFASLEEFIIFGGYPDVVLSDKKEDRIDILRSIFDLYIKKEIVEYLKIENVLQVKKLIQYLAVNNAQKIKYQNIAQFSGFSQKTVKKYVELLKETFLVVEVRPFFTNKNKELVKIPKIYFLDTGVANFFINNFNGFDLRNDSPFLFENYILGELIKNILELDAVKFWQDKNQTEIDFIVESRDKIAGIEVKFKKVLTSSDFSAFDIFGMDYSKADCFLVGLSTQKVHEKVKIMLPYRTPYTIAKFLR